MVERQFQSSVKCVPSDNGTEFTSLTKYFHSKGITHETSCVGTPQQNGRAERKHKHILNVARALRFQAKLPIDFWGECILTAGYLINQLNKGDKFVSRSRKCIFVGYPYGKKAWRLYDSEKR
uniref:Retrovirus-related Pol polyprotein from transposon TNT 1-94 n=1 Tax=Noccaea caerulescens TaxID=107243 RepID=A0A1J3EWA9_NOCCA